MEVQVDKEGYHCRLSISVNADEVEAAFQRAYRKVSKSARIPGFRPGKAPKSVLEMHYGPQIQNEVENDLTTTSLAQAMREHDVDPVSRPRVAFGELKRKTGFSYTADIEVRPEVSLKNYRGLKAPTLEFEVVDADVDEQLDRLRENSAQLVPVLVRDAVETGDLVLIDYQGTMGGMPLEGVQGENQWVEIGRDGTLKGLSEGLIGARVPTERSVPIEFSDDHPQEDLRGKPASFKVTLKEIKTKELPELNDDFAQDLGESSLIELRNKIKESMSDQKRHEAEQKQRQALLKSLTDENPLEVPPSMVEEQADRMIAGAVARVQQMTGSRLNPEDLDLPALRVEHYDDAEQQVKSGLLLLEVSKAEKLDVSEEELDAEIAKLSEQAGEHAPRLQAMYRDPDERRRLSYRMLEDKTVAFLLEHATLEAPEENIETQNSDSDT